VFRHSRTVGIAHAQFGRQWVKGITHLPYACLWGIHWLRCYILCFLWKPFDKAFYRIKNVKKSISSRWICPFHVQHNLGKEIDSLLIPSHSPWKIAILYNLKTKSMRQMRCVKSTSIDTSCVISSSNPMFDYFLELPQWDECNKVSNEA